MTQHILLDRTDDEVLVLHRQVGQAIGAKPLHPAAFMVHAHQQVAAHGLDGAGQLQQLGAVMPIASK